jgi:(2Fe-2S) ferredoxin
MSQYRCHIFVCTSGSWCPRDGDTDGIVKRLKQAVNAAGLRGQVRINKSGCFNQCGHGPMVVVYPQGHWYAGVTPEDAAELIEAELVRGEPLARLRYLAPPGDNKDLSRYPAELVAAEQSRKGDDNPLSPARQ